MPPSLSAVSSPELRYANGHASPHGSKPAVSSPVAGPSKPMLRTTSSSRKLDSMAANVNDLDCDELFAKHTIAEVKLVQQRLRADADAKQEELRLMVGERYRDLLQASTSILAIAKSSDHVLEALDEMRETISSTSVGRSARPATLGDEDKHLQALQSLASHMKLLLDSPEHLWRLIERKSYLQAAWLFLLARVVHRALTRQDEEQGWHSYGIDVMEQMPLVQRQWDIVTPFRSQISHKATLSLREADSSPGEVCATLLCLHLLESRPLPETLSIYLAQRSKTISALLHPPVSSQGNGHIPGSKPNGKPLHRPRKTVVRETKQKLEAVFALVARTMGTARTIFANAVSGGPAMMSEALHFLQDPSEAPGTLPPELQLTTQVLLTTIPSSTHLLLLPPSIRSYKPYVDTESFASSLSEPHLQAKVTSWFKKVTSDLEGAIADWSLSLESIHEIWDVRSSLLQWLKTAEGLQPSEVDDLQAIINLACRRQAAQVWRAALERLDASFRTAASSSSAALMSNPTEHRHDSRPTDFLFFNPPLPSTSQSLTGTASFQKYQTALQRQLGGRTPLLDSVLTSIEGQAKDVQKDLSILVDDREETSTLIAELLEAYRADAEAVCEKMTDALEHAASTQDESSMRGSVFLARVTREVCSSASLFSTIGCSASRAEELRRRVSTLYEQIIDRWQAHIVSTAIKQIHVYSPSQRADARARADTAVDIPRQPTGALTQALMAVSSSLQEAGVYLVVEQRSRMVGGTLRHFVKRWLSQSPQDSSVEHPTATLESIWDLGFLRRLTASWGPDIADVASSIEESIDQGWRMITVDEAGKSRETMEDAIQDCLARTQILFAPLLPLSPSPAVENPPAAKPDKSAALLPLGSPAAEQRVEPALDLVKPSPRFGLLMVGSISTR